MSKTVDTDTQQGDATRALMVFVRFVMPGLIVLSGVLLAVIGNREAAYEVGALLVSAGASVALLNLLYRVGVRGDKDRGREEAAREHYDRTGHWPGE